MENCRICVSKECENASRIIRTLNDIDDHQLHKNLKLSNFKQELQKAQEHLKLQEIYTNRQNQFKATLECVLKIKSYASDLEKFLLNGLDNDEKSSEAIYIQTQLAIKEQISQNFIEVKKDQLDLFVILIEDGPQQFQKKLTQKSLDGFQTIDNNIQLIEEQLKIIRTQLELQINVINNIPNLQENMITAKDNQINLLQQKLDILEQQQQSWQGFHQGVNSQSMISPTTKLSKNVFRWSQTLKSQKNKFISSTVIRCDDTCIKQPLYIKNGSVLHGLHQQNLIQNHLHKIIRFPSDADLIKQFQYITVQILQDDVAIGVVNLEQIEKRKFMAGDEMEELGHGCYMLSSKSRIYSNSNDQLNCQKKGFLFGINEILTISISFDEKLISFSNEIKSFSMKLGEGKEQLYFAVQLSSKGDQLEILK